MSNKRPLPSSSADPSSNPDIPSPKRQRSSPHSASPSHPLSQSPSAAPASAARSTPQTPNIKSRPSSSGQDGSERDGRNVRDAASGTNAGSGRETNSTAPRPIPADELLEKAEAPITQKRAMVLREFLEKMDDYAPIIPDTLTTHYLTLAGLPPPPQTPLPLARLLALAVQKFIADLAADAYQHARIRSGHSTSNSTVAAVAAAATGGAASGAGGAAGGVSGATGAAAAGAGATTGGGRAPNIGTQRPGYGGGGGAGAGGAGAAGKQGVERTVLTMEDLGMAVGEYGVNVRRGEFYR